MQPQKLIVIGLLILFASTMQAQISINVNIGTPPPWGPQVQADVRYYYLPDVHSYYDMNTSMFVYYYNGNWIHRRHLPHRFRNYDLYHGRKIVVTNYRGNAPYSHCKYHKNGDKKNFKTIERTGRANHRNFENNDNHKNREEGNTKFAQSDGNRHNKEKDRKD